MAVELVPLTDHKTDVTPRRETNPSIPMTQLIVPIKDTTSKCTAELVRQVKRSPHRFTVDRLTDGPK